MPWNIRSTKRHAGNEMSYINNNMIALLALAVWLSVPSAFAGGVDAVKQRTAGSDPVAGKVKSRLCQGCHGEDGNSNSELIPNISGQYEKYILKQLRDYQAGIRSHEIMNAMTVSLSEGDIADISSYFAKQAKMKGNKSTNSEQGRSLYINGNKSLAVIACISCHGAAGKGLIPDAPMYPIIGGQHKAYLLKQLIDFREDDRTNGPNATMNKIARPLGDADLEALAEYLSGQ